MVPLRCAGELINTVDRRMMGGGDDKEDEKEGRAGEVQKAHGC